MKMKINPIPKGFPVMKKNPFTLIELLIVVAIIAILMAIALPAIFSALDNAKVTQCKQEMRNIQQACEQYKNEYGTLPMFNSVKSSGKIDPNTGSVTDYETLLSVLSKKPYAGKGDIKAGNKRGITFWAPPPNFTKTDFELKDPWGNYYVIWFDYKDEGRVGKATTGDNLVHGSVHVISYGPDAVADITETNTQLFWNRTSGDLTTWQE